MVWRVVSSYSRTSPSRNSTRSTPTSSVTSGPRIPFERDLVHEIVCSRWRLRRIERMECALMSQAVEQQLEILGEDADIATAEALAFFELAENSKGLRLIERYSRSLRRSYEKASQELDRLQRERAEQNEPEPELDTDYLSRIGDPRFQDNGFMNAVLPYLHKQNQLAPETRKSGMNGLIVIYSVPRRILR